MVLQSSELRLGLDERSHFQGHLRGYQQVAPAPHRVGLSHYRVAQSVASPRAEDPGAREGDVYGSHSLL